VLPVDGEYIFVDGGSTDGSSAVAEELPSMACALPLDARPGSRSRTTRLTAASNALGRSQGKKIGWRDALATPIHLLRFNVFAR
jgi:hypothetical protein